MTISIQISPLSIESSLFDLNLRLLVSVRIFLLHVLSQKIKYRDDIFFLDRWSCCNLSRHHCSVSIGG